MGIGKRIPPKTVYALFSAQGEIVASFLSWQRAATARKHRNKVDAARSPHVVERYVRDEGESE